MNAGELAVDDRRDGEGRRRKRTETLLLLGCCFLVFGGLATGVGVVFWMCANC